MTVLERVSEPRGRGIISPMKTPPLVPDDLWEAIEPLLPTEPPKPKGERPRVPDRAATVQTACALKAGLNS